MSGRETSGLNLLGEKLGGATTIQTATSKHLYIHFRYKQYPSHNGIPTPDLTPLETPPETSEEPSPFVSTHSNDKSG